jgi:hypothetical protein
VATFPRTEAGIIDLAQKVTSGLASEGETFPSPPVPVAELRAALKSYRSARAAALAAAKAAKEQYALKAEALQHVTELLKTDIRYAENRVSYDDEKLKLIGWGAPRPKTKLKRPGQVKGLVVGQQGEGDISLSWSKPEEGGKVAAYQIQSRHEGGRWREAGVTLETEVTLLDQERGVELEYQVIAVNKAGVGKPSNVAMAVL